MSKPQQTAERARHEALARETGSWQSWTVENWWTNRVMALEVDQPFSLPHMRLDFECLCDAVGRHAHQYDLTRSCVFVDAYEVDPNVMVGLNKNLKRAQRSMATQGGVPLVVGDEPWEAAANPGLLVYQMRIQGG